MTDIEKRAHFAEKKWLLSENVTRYGYEQGYIHGATDQDPISRADERKKVIEKACEWFKKETPCGIGGFSVEAIIARFKQAMEEQK